ncbi:hypothetical protein HMPREF9073_02948 [Capnocytophaga sp. oral taxon 326 str. F0382]|nr:hypothetical protein HMPREF9073_02948 [Capnocytophaga sp. oral taxon 326 str. F0382]
MIISDLIFKRAFLSNNHQIKKIRTLFSLQRYKIISIFPISKTW